MVYVLAGLLLAILGYAVFLLQNKADVDKEIEELCKKDESYLLAELYVVNIVLGLCALGGFLLTANYAITYMSGSDIRFLASWGMYEWLGAMLGLVVTTAITGVQVVLYANPTHHRAGMLVTFLVICFALFSEIGSPMEKEEMKVAQRSENSATYKAVVGAIQGGNLGSLPSAYSGVMATAKAKLSQHQLELGRCNRHKSKGQKRVERCELYEKKQIAFYQAQVDSYSENMKQEAQQNQATQLAMVAEAKKLEHNTDKHSGLIKFVKESLATTYLSAMMLASLILIVAFESGFHFAGSRAAVLKAALIRLGNQDIIYRSELKRRRKAEHFSAKTVSDTPSDTSTNTAKQSYPRGQDQAETAKKKLVDTASQRTESTVSEQPETVRVQSEQPKQSDTATVSSADTVDKAIDKTGSADIAETVPSDKDKALMKSIYRDMVMAIKSGDLSLTARPVKAFVSLRVRDKTIKEIQQISDTLLAKAKQEGVIIDNPNYREGNRKPKYLKAA